jgi:hypothetical protein
VFSLLGKKNWINAVFAVMILTAVISHAKKEGIVGRTKKNKKGCTCHDEVSSNNVIVSINGPDTLKVVESSLYSVTISGASMKAAGINISASDGELKPLTSDLKKIKRELTHTSPQRTVSGDVVFQFSYYAPEFSGEQTIFASGNLADMNGKKNGDLWFMHLTKQFK